MPDNAVCFQYNSKCRRNRSWFKRKCDGIQVIADSAKKMKEISIEQADRMEQVEATAERIAEVVQNNSAAAQETSATSEELTAQATTLSGMVSVFKLRQ